MLEAMAARKLPGAASVYSLSLSLSLPLSIHICPPSTVGLDCAFFLPFAAQIDRLYTGYVCPLLFFSVVRQRRFVAIKSSPD